MYTQRNPFPTLMHMFGAVQTFKTAIRARHKLSINLLTKRKMQCGLDTSPPIHRWMKDTLDRNAFHTSLQVLGLRVPANKTASILKSEYLKRCVTSMIICTRLMYNRRAPLSRYIIDLPKIKNVVWDPSGEQDRRVVLLKVKEEGASASQHTNHC